ncbi:DUF4259 domain-containing protein [Streptomyces sp. NPDC056227]|uniref:DUF4259 domain-containing protein n=1 Tax=Streptomyces sp. NPDC056227 TaxID=3345753 RepID=UPI0035D90C04
MPALPSDFPVLAVRAIDRILAPDSELAALWGDSGDADEWWDILVRPRAVLDATGAATLCREPPGSKTKTPVRIDGRGISSPILNSSVCALRAICGKLQ